MVADQSPEERGQCSFKIVIAGPGRRRIVAAEDPAGGPRRELRRIAFRDPKEAIARDRGRRRGLRDRAAGAARSREEAALDLRRPRGAGGRLVLRRAREERGRRDEHAGAAYNEAQHSRRHVPGGVRSGGHGGRSFTRRFAPRCRIPAADTHGAESMNRAPGRIDAQEKFVTDRFTDGRSIVGRRAATAWSWRRTRALGRAASARRSCGRSSDADPRVTALRAGIAVMLNRPIRLAPTWSDLGEAVLRVTRDHVLCCTEPEPPDTRVRQALRGDEARRVIINLRGRGGPDGVTEAELARLDPARIRTIPATRRSSLAEAGRRTASSSRCGIDGRGRAEEPRRSSRSTARPIDEKWRSCRRSSGPRQLARRFAGKERAALRGRQGKVGLS